jgi:predicted metal-dependent hydrolase
MFDREIKQIATRLCSESNFKFPHWYDVYCVNQRRGKCNNSFHYITIPLWAVERSKKFLEYYIAHELSHVFSGSHNHGDEFMKTFRRICPLESQRFELGYKPRAAKRAGIRR